MFRGSPSSNLLAQAGRLWMLNSDFGRGCWGFCSLGTPSMSAAQCQPRPQLWFLLKYPRNSSNHYSSPLISSWYLCMLFTPLVIEVVTCRKMLFARTCATEIRSRFQLFCGSEDWLCEVTSCCVIPWDAFEYDLHVGQGSVFTRCIPSWFLSERLMLNEPGLI